MKKQLTIGVTGGIGAGKSLVCQIISSLGYPVFYSDKESKRIIDSDLFVKKELIKLLGASAYVGDKLNKPYVASVIFSDPILLEKMNAIVHPAVRAYFSDWSKKQSESLVFNEAAILFETGSYKDFDYTLLVTCPQEIRLQRVIKRDSSHKEAVLARMNQQWSDDKKEKLADFIIQNDDHQLVVPQVIAILKLLA